MMQWWQNRKIVIGKQLLMVAVGTAILTIYCYFVDIPKAVGNSMFTMGFFFTFVGAMRYLRDDGFLTLSKFSPRTEEERKAAKAKKLEKENPQTRLTDYSEQKEKIVLEKVIVGLLAIVLSFFFF